MALPLKTKILSYSFLKAIIFFGNLQCEFFIQTFLSPYHLGKFVDGIFWLKALYMRFFISNSSFHWVRLEVLTFPNILISSSYTVRSTTFVRDRFRLWTFLTYWNLVPTRYVYDTENEFEVTPLLDLIY